MKSIFTVGDGHGGACSPKYNTFPDGQIQFVAPESYLLSHLTCSIFDSEGWDLFIQMIYTLRFDSITIRYLYGARSDKSHNGETTVANLPEIFTTLIKGSKNHPDLVEYTIWAPHCELDFDYEEVIPIPTDMDSIDYTAVIYPDKSAYKRMGHLFTAPAVIASKTRDQVTGQITGHSLPILHNHGTYLVADDLCDGGATFVSVARLLPSTATVDLYVTHGLFSKGLDELKKYYRNIWASKSCPGNFETKNWCA